MAGRDPYKYMRRTLSRLIPRAAREWGRTQAFRVEARLHRLRFAGLDTPEAGWPILLLLTTPKSGTHLLIQIVAGFSRVTPFAPHVPYVFPHLDGKTGEALGPDAALGYLGGLRPLDIGAIHLPYSRSAATRLAGPQFLCFFLIRDPRDIAVSMAYFFGDREAEHRLFRYFQPLTLEERLAAIIRGIPGPLFAHEDIGSYISKFTPWLDEPGMVSLRFEDLIHNRRAVLEQIIDRFLVRVNTLRVSRGQIAAALESGINPGYSPTFRSGKTGSWREHFTRAHKELFKEVAGDLLIGLGYENGYDW